jgi:hypothetical protein
MDAVKSKFLLKALGKKCVCGNVQTLVSECRSNEGSLEARQRRTTVMAKSLETPSFLATNYHIY